jgi:hypothetical protein
MAAPRLLYVVTEDWYFLSHRLPMARAAQQAGYEVHVATRLKDGAASIAKEGFVPHALDWSRGSLSPLGSLSAIVELRRLLRGLKPDILHNISLKPVLLGTAASLGVSDTAVVNSLTGLGTLFIGEAQVSGVTRRAVRFALRHLLTRKRSRAVVQNPDDRAFVDVRIPRDADRAEVREADREAGRRQDRERLPVRRHRPGEADDARRGRKHRRARPGTDRDAAVLAGGVRMRLIERERLQDRPLDGPCPRACRGHEDKHEEDRQIPPPHNHHRLCCLVGQQRWRR